MKEFYHLLFIFLLGCFYTAAQEGIVSGVLADEQGPLPGASIVVKGTTNGTQADFDGNYSLRCKVGDVLVITYVGYETREVTVTPEMLGFTAPMQPDTDYKKVTPIQTSAYQKAVQQKKDTTGLIPDMSKTPLYYSGGRIDLRSYRIKKIRFSGDKVKLNLFSPESFFEASITQQNAIRFVSSGNLWQTQNTFSQGRPSGGINQWFGPDSNEIFSFGPGVASLEFDGSNYAFDPNGRLVASGTGNGLAANIYNNELLSTVFKNRTEFNIAYSTQDLIYRANFTHTNQENIFGKGNLRKNVAFIDVRTNNGNDTQWHGNIKYIDENNNNPDINGLYSNIFLTNAITPTTFNNRLGNRLEDGTLRSFAPDTYNNPNGLLNLNNNNTLYRLFQASIQQTTRFPNRNKLISKLSYQNQKDEFKFALPLSTIGFTEGIVNQRDFNENQLFFNNSFLIDGYIGGNEINIKVATDYTYKDLSYHQKEQTGFAQFPFQDPVATSNQTLFLKNHTLRLQQNAVYEIYEPFDLRFLVNNEMFISSVQEDALWLPSFALDLKFYNLFNSYDEWFSGLNFGVGLTNSISEAPLFYNNYSHNSLLISPAESQSYLATNDLFIRPELGLERSHKFEIETSILLFYQLDFGVTYFNSENRDAIFPVLNQNQFTLQNVANIRNRGFEAFVDYELFWENSDVRGNIGLTFSKYQTKVLKLKGGIDNVPIAGFNNVNAQLIEGQPAGVLVGSAYRRNEAGEIIIGANGFPLVAEDPKIIGDPIPDFNLGFTSNLNYKRWALDFAIDWQKGGDVWNGTQNVLDFHGASKKSARLRETTGFVFNGVTVDGLPNTTAVDFANPANGIQGNRWAQYGFSGVAEDAIESGSYINLKYVQLSYEIDRKWEEHFFKGIKISVYAENLWTNTSFRGASPYSTLFGNQSANALNLFNTPLFTEVGLTLKFKI